MEIRRVVKGTFVLAAVKFAAKRTASKASTFWFAPLGATLLWLASRIGLLITPLDLLPQFEGARDAAKIIVYLLLAYLIVFSFWFGWYPFHVRFTSRGGLIAILRKLDRPQMFMIVTMVVGLGLFMTSLISYVRSYTNKNLGEVYDKLLTEINSNKISENDRDIMKIGEEYLRYFAYSKALDQFEQAVVAIKNNEESRFKTAHDKSRSTMERMHALAFNTEMSKAMRNAESQAVALGHPVLKESSLISVDDLLNPAPGEPEGNEDEKRKYRLDYKKLKETVSPYIKALASAKGDLTMMKVGLDNRISSYIPIKHK